MSSPAASAPPRPRIICNPAGIPTELHASTSWVHWHFVFRDGAWAKVPRRFVYVPAPPPGFANWFVQGLDHLQPRSWMAFEDAAHWPLLQNEFFGRTAIGLGLVLSDDDPYTFIDLDDCRDPATGDVAPWAMEIVDRFASFTEISNSGTGLKIYVRGRKPGRRCRTSKRPGIEVYDRARFAAVTGWHLAGTPTVIADRQAELDAFYAELFPAEEFTHDSPPASTARPTLLTDAELVDRILSSGNADKFRRLWAGDASHYRHASGKPDHSAADFAMAGTLAFWCGPDPGRIESLMRQSGLVRDKWNRPNYLADTIQKAIARSNRFYGDGQGPFEAGGHLHFEEFAGMTAEDVAANVREVFGRDRGDRGAAQEQPPAKPPCSCPCKAHGHTAERAHAIDFSEFAAPAAAPVPAAPPPAPKKAREHAPGCMFFSLVYNLAGHAEVRRLLCGRWSCPCCGGLLQTKWRAHARTVIEHLVEVGLGTTKRTDNVYVGNVSGKVAWQRIKKQIQRADGQFIRVTAPDGDYTVCSTVEFEGASAIPPPNAAIRIVAAISAIPTRPGTRSPIHTSRGWKLPRPKPSEWTRAGTFDKSTKQADVVKALDNLGYQMIVRTPSHTFFRWAARIRLDVGPDESVHQAAMRTFAAIQAELIGFELLPVERRSGTVADDGVIVASTAAQELLLAT